MQRSTLRVDRAGVSADGGRIRWFVVVLLLLLCIGGCLYRVVDVVWFGPAIRISPETTVVEGPLGPDGFIDYFAVVNQRMSAGVTPENNAAVLIVRALGPGAFDHVADNEFYRLLEMEPLPSDAPRLVDSNEFGAESAAAGAIGPVDANLAATMSRAWTRDEFPQSAAWIDANAAAFELAVEATHRDRFYMPVVPAGSTSGLVDAALPLQQRCRAIARLLASRAMLRLGEGDLSGADADLVACHRLASLVGQGPFSISDLVSIAIDAIAARGDSELLADARLTGDAARRMLGERRDLPPLPDLALTIDGDERFMMIDSVCGLVRGRPGAPGGVAPMPLVGIDGNRVLVSMNETYDEAAQAMQIDDYARRSKALDAIEQDFNVRTTKKMNTVTLTLSAIVGSRAASSRQAADMLLALLAPAIVQVQTAEDRGAARRRLLVIGCALAVYRAEHGQYPAGLDALVPDLLESVPLDPFGDAPFIYHQSDERGCRLHSVGDNLRDDGGATFDSEPKGDDIPLETRASR